jgi:hypothetical protein
MKAEIHRLRAEVSRLKRLQFQGEHSTQSQNSRERRSHSLTSRPARLNDVQNAAGDLELRSPTTKDRHPSVSGLHHRRHPQEFVSLLKDSNQTGPKDALVSKHSDSSTDDQLESQEPEPTQQENEVIVCEASSFLSVVMDRAGWLAGLLVLQSLSSFIIQRNEILLEDHAVIIRFLTMLVGAGGNAGNQATVKGAFEWIIYRSRELLRLVFTHLLLFQITVIRGLAVGTIRADSFLNFWKEELKVGLAISGILAVAGCVRVAVFAVPWKETLAITCSLFSIVWISTVLGSLLPMGLKLLRIDPAHSSTTIQVIMDILGVTITVCKSNERFTSYLHSLT